MDNNYRKYLKYKNKYKQLVGGGANPNDDTCREICKFLNELMESMRVTSASEAIYKMFYSLPDSLPDPYIIEINSDKNNGDKNNGGAGFASEPINPINKCINKYKELILSSIESLHNKHLIFCIMFLLNIQPDMINDQQIRVPYQIYLTTNVLVESNGDIPLNDPSKWTNIRVWKGPFLMEDFWDSEFDEFLKEYNKFEVSRQSFFLFWANLVNFARLFAKITSCSVFLTGDKKFDYTPASIGKLVLQDNSSEEISTFYTYGTFYKSKDSTIEAQDTTDATGETSQHKTDEKLLRAQQYTQWSSFKYELVKLLISALSCDYNNIFDFYSNYISYLFNTNVSQVKEQLNLSLMNKDTSLLFLSFFQIQNTKFCRRDVCTRFQITTIDPRLITDNLLLNPLDSIYHDFVTHRELERKSKLKTTDMIEIQEFLQQLLQSFSEKETLAFIFDIYHERGRSTPFSKSDFVLLLNELLGAFKYSEIIYNFMILLRNYQTVKDGVKFVFNDDALRLIELYCDVWIIRGKKKYSIEIEEREDL